MCGIVGYTGSRPAAPILLAGLSHLEYRGYDSAGLAVREGGFAGKKAVIGFNVVQVAANLLAWVVLAPVLDIVIYAEPVNKVFAQGAWACLGNVIIVAILGTPLCLGYSKMGGKASSLQKED